MNQYTVATLLNLKGTFKSATGVAVDPDEVKAFVMDPDGIVEELTDDVSKLSTGVYQTQYAPLKNGLYTFRFAGYSDPGDEPIASSEGNFTATTEFLAQGAP